MDKAIQAYMADLLPLCAKAGLTLSSERDIAYGVQLEFSSGSDSILLNVYHSVKRGISVVIGAKGKNPLRPKLEACLQPKTYTESIPQHNWKTWIGSDETGKGDYFGPLIVCGFYMDRKDHSKLSELGVCDSKKLNQEQIIRIAKAIYKDYPKQIECLLLKPLKYNELYANFSGQHKNLNDLLAWSHAKVLDTLIKRLPTPDGIFIDQFSHAKKASAFLHKLHPELPVIERPDGEQDLAVAAASIIARYQLLLAFQSQNRFYKLNFPMGAGSGVKTAGRDFIRQFGKERLGEVAKLHFKTTLEL